MSEKITCTRIILEGMTSYAIQGINLRENIEEYVKTHLGSEGQRPKGKISNLKNGQVEIIFHGERSDLDKLMKYLDKPILPSKRRREVSVIKRKESYDIQIDSETLSEFAIERSDDLSEMVWALRGAGIRFKNATDALKELHDTLQERDKNTAIGRLLTLRDELLYNSILLTRIKNNKRLKERARIVEKIKTTALNSNIENPAVPTRKFVQTLGEVYSDFNSDDIYQIQRIHCSRLTHSEN
jgi:acylphosphatase